MNSLQQKNILLGISGGIAAYKAPDLVRKLKAAGANVRVVLTDSARHFVSPLSLQAVSGETVSVDLLDPAAEAAMGHIELAKWADTLLIAPATANIIAKLCHGLADDLLTTLALATNAPIFIAPAMNQQMWRAEITRQNVQNLQQRGINILGPAAGEQACGDIGPGRMLEPEQLVNELQQSQLPLLLTGKGVLITAGPTREAIDPVRYLSNHSSGKMGYALASVAASMGAEVQLISGPCNLPRPSNVEVIAVDSAAQMHEAVMSRVADCDIFIGCAAVADYRIREVAEQKIKKNAQELTLTLVKNPDILADVAALPNSPFTLGFAAETEDVSHYAKQKLARKNINMIAANDVSDQNIGFNSDNNAITLYWPDGEMRLPLDSKMMLAQRILIELNQHYNNA